MGFLIISQERPGSFCKEGNDLISSFILLRDLKTVNFAVERTYDYSPQGTDFIIKAQKSILESSLPMEIESQC